MDTLSIRWLGVAGIELHIGGQFLAIDPFFTRPPFWRLWLGRVQPDHLLITEKLPHCQSILVSHAHYDHVMDVPVAAVNTGALVFGSENTCRLMKQLGVPIEQIRLIRAGDRLDLGPYRGEVLPAEHLKVLGFGTGPLKEGLHTPLRLRDYRMDTGFCFYLQAAGIRLLVWPSEKAQPAMPADVLFLRLPRVKGYLESLLSQVRPQLVIPIHWDDFFRPLTTPIRPVFEPPRPVIPSFRRVNLGESWRLIEKIDPGIKVLVPEIFRSYIVNDLVC